MIHIERKLVLLGFGAILAFTVCPFYPGSCVLAVHSLKEQSHFDCLVALGTVNCNGVEVSVDAERALIAFVDPGCKTAGVVGVAAKSDHITVGFEADRAVILDVDEIGVAVVHVEIVEIDCRGSRLVSPWSDDGRSPAVVPGDTGVDECYYTYYDWDGKKYYYKYGAYSH